MLGTPRANSGHLSQRFGPQDSPPPTIVIPADAGTQCSVDQQALEVPIYRQWMDGHAPFVWLPAEPWVPASAGMTVGGWLGPRRLW
jgi:hypothetical protein